MSVDIRPATSADAARCAEIYAPYVTDNWVSFECDPPDAVEMAQRIENYGASHGWLVAEVEGKIAGYAYGSPHRTREAYATSADVAVYLDTAFARAGIGRQLYEALFPILADRNIHAIFAGIALPNDASIGLHEAMGFTPVGIYREVGWKMGGWRDVGWWQRLL
ncbi:MAG: arsinothricin resistance N-acetyltransferase ArsN1 family B [Sphingopyxis sp.]|uniref:arsinothricin resistance N-acetyltransferase ArsN1 family B n=1 Tax=unclassified Sphingopyxis TaxID=2614943 RepID=UPI00073094EA|nr:MULTISPECIES: arsinothricin resistance N-acetyltransferase ArsN1 family B [unclassified Sphingopyxis]KTE01202.1 acetyltransferase [Sphingopyxis sp. H012]KTE04987.1 acetyltransferase [Sphingopyxis sp. H093]KTE12552.1 acetyltransferase [Sphingopyxis sp. H053]KTE26785.1 acetyltransferase [Sphingopyxis sp. H080]KTE34742.1 acetyltransferase [Sphingopyxis sp. H038]